MKYTWKNIILPIMRWLLANAIFPILIPVVVLVLGDCFFFSIFHVLDPIKKLLFEGFYIFSAMTLVFSLFEDFSTFQKAIKPLTAMFLMAPIFGTSIIFYASERKGLGYFEEHLSLFLIIWGLLVLYATYIKYKMIRFKLKYQY